MHETLNDSELKELKSKLVKEISSLQNQQHATKIANNSLYGAFSNVWFRFYDIELARAITLTGQTIIKKITREMNEYLNNAAGTKDYKYIFYGDTDSIFVRLEPLVQKFYPDVSDEDMIPLLEKLCNERFNPKLEEICKNHEDKTGVFKNVLTFKREIIADKMLIASKKHYVMKHNNSEGVIYDKHKMKIKGFEIVKSSTPQKVRNMLRETVRVTMDSGDKTSTKDYIKKCETEFFTLPYQEIAFPRSCNNLAQYSREGIYTKGTPAQVRGALLYNHHVKRLNLEHKYELITEGEKIKFLYLKMPNPIQENVISFPSGGIPEEFGLEGYIDYDIMFEKAYCSALDNIISCLGWKTQEAHGFDI